ncbi:hypothetical protein ONZ45_g13027 [Pleurotus djamor]|nr:hypothetical protein ONZ45_g13027 [Pleurotus djamor]
MAIPMPTKEGTIAYQVDGEEFQTAYEIHGDLRTKRPLVVLHGGPGVPHNYLLAHHDIYTTYGIPVVFYDQLGCGKSTRLPNKPKTFWTIELFMDELDNLLAHLGIQNNFDLLGQSWGGMLASSYVAFRQPVGLNRLVIADSPASMELWEKATGMLLDALPEELRTSLRKHEEQGTYESKEYQDAMQVFYARHVCRLDPWPQEVHDAFKLLDEDSTVYNIMNGPSEFTITGGIKPWSIINDLHKISCKTLIINGAHDEAQDLCVDPFFKNIPHVKWVQFANSSHMPFVEERERYMKIVTNFLQQ